MSDHSQDQTTTTAANKGAEPAKAAPEQFNYRGIPKLVAMLASGDVKPVDVATLIDLHGGERPQMFKLLQQTLGNTFVRQVIAFVGIDKNVDAKGLPHNTGASADEVDGIPTGNATHYDDETAIQMNVHSDTAKWGGGIKDGAANVNRTAIHQDIEGENKDTKTNKVDVTVGKVGGPTGPSGAAIAGSHANEHEISEGNSTKNTYGGGAQIAGGVASVKGNFEHEKVVDGQKHGHGFDGGASYDSNKGEFGVDGGYAHNSGTEDHAKQVAVTAGYDKSKGVQGGGAFTKTDKVGTTPEGAPIVTKTAVGGHIHGLGGETKGGDASFAHTNAAGTAQSASAGVDWGKDGVSAHAGYSIMNKDGTGAHMSASHGTKVTAKAPTWNIKTGVWEVQYVRTTDTSVGVGGSVGAGGNSIGVDLGESSAHFDSGIRHFENFVEAWEFSSEAAEKLGPPPPFSPATTCGAMLIPIGETRGGGTSDAISADGTLTIQGASVGGGVNHADTHEVDIRRLDASRFDVASIVDGETVKHLNIAGNGLANTKSWTKEHRFSVVYRFDLAKKGAAEAFEAYCKTKLPPSPAVAEWQSLEEMTSNTKLDDIKILGSVFDQNWKENTTEDHLTDHDGQHDKYDGTRSNDVTTGAVGHFLGDKNSHASANLEANVENGKETSYTATIQVGGESGSRNREALNQWFAMGDAKGTDATSSGDWKLTADVSVAAIHQLEHDVHDFKGKTPEEKQRILSGMVAEGGGVNIHEGKPLDWDVELSGDPNFPGASGRKQLDDKLKDYGDQLKTAPKDAGPVLAKIDATIKELATRHTNIDDRSKYTDLPGELRHKVLDQIMRYITSFKTLRSKAQTDVMAQHTTDAGHNGKYAAEQTRLDTANTNIVRDHAAVMVADKAVNQAKDHIIEGHKDELSAALSTVHDYRSAALALNARQMQLDGPIEAARGAYLHSSDPATAIEAVLKPTEDKAALLATMLIELCEAARALKPVTTPNGVHGHEKFWATIDGEVGSGANGGDS